MANRLILILQSYVVLLHGCPHVLMTSQFFYLIQADTIAEKLSDVTVAPCRFRKTDGAKFLAAKRNFMTFNANADTDR